MITGGLSATVMAKVAEPVPYGLVALIVALKVPATVGMPLMRPEEVFTLSPVGKPLAP